MSIMLADEMGVENVRAPEGPRENKIQPVAGGRARLTKGAIRSQNSFESILP
jgi:hypothetical protein